LDFFSGEIAKARTGNTMAEQSDDHDAHTIVSTANRIRPAGQTMLGRFAKSRFVLQNITLDHMRDSRDDHGPEALA
jgi:hypothetical protein